MSFALLILQIFRRFTYVTAHSPTLPLLHLRHSSFSNPPFDSPTSQGLHLGLIHLTRAHSPTFPSLYLRHSSFSNSSVASPTSQFILQPFFRFSYVSSSSFNSPGELPMIYNRSKFLPLVQVFMMIKLGVGWKLSSTFDLEYVWKYLNSKGHQCRCKYQRLASWRANTLIQLL